MRTQEEIVAKIEASQSLFGFEKSVWVGGLDFAHAKPYLKEEVTEAEWEVENPLDAMRVYMVFAIEKATDHRGLSAGRSVENLNAWTWLLGCEPITEPYPQYGVPILKALAQRHGLDWPDDTALERMAQGLPCHDDCMDGCGA